MIYFVRFQNNFRFRGGLHGSWQVGLKYKNVNKFKYFQTQFWQIFNTTACAVKRFRKLCFLTVQKNKLVKKYTRYFRLFLIKPVVPVETGCE